MKINIEKVVVFKWECPRCEFPNYQENDPEYVGSVYCENCGELIELNSETND